MTDVTVRRFRAGDTDLLWRVHDRALRESAMDYDPEYNRYLRHVERDFFDVGGWFAVAEADGERPAAVNADEPALVAIGGFQPLDYVRDGDDGELGWLPAEESTTCRIRSVAVYPKWQGEGVGTALVGYLEDRADELGFEYTVLQTYRSMEQACRFYEARGYSVLAESENAAAERWYGKRLSTK